MAAMGNDTAPAAGVDRDERGVLHSVGRERQVRERAQRAAHDHVRILPIPGHIRSPTLLQNPRLEHQSYCWYF